jgi:hypothetical protein
MPRPASTTSGPGLPGLERRVAARLAGLKTPSGIQDFVNALRWNAEPAGPTARSVAEALRHGEAHCVEGAFVAAYLAEKQDSQAAYEDLIWSLVNSKEFLFNH